MSTEKHVVWVVETVVVVEGNMFVIHRNGEMGNSPTVSENSGMHIRTLLGPGRSLFCPEDGTVRGRHRSPR